MAAERSTGGKVCARRIKATRRRAEILAWIDDESWLAAIILPIATAVMALFAYTAAHLVFWLQHLGR